MWFVSKRLYIYSSELEVYISHYSAVPEKSLNCEINKVEMTFFNPVAEDDKTINDKTIQIASKQLHISI